MTKSIRNYIRSILTENRTTIPFVDAYPNEVVFYNPDEVWESTMDLLEWAGADVPADQDLHFFVVDGEGEVSGAAFIRLSENKFSFTIVSDENDALAKKELLSECLEEYDACRGENPSLMLEVVDKSMALLLREAHGFHDISGSSSLLSE